MCYCWSPGSQWNQLFYLSQPQACEFHYSHALAVFENTFKLTRTQFWLLSVAGHVAIQTVWICYEQAQQWVTKTCSKSKGLLRWRNPTLLHSPVVSNFVFHQPLIIGRLNWTKHARPAYVTVHSIPLRCPSPAGAFTSRLFLKTSRFRLGSLGLWPGAGTWDDNYTVLPLSGRVAEPSAH